MKSQPCADHKNWKTLYRAAIAETNEATIPGKIAIAENAILARGREIFYQEGCFEEKDALETALQAIRAFRAARGKRQARAHREESAPATIARRVLPNWNGTHAEFPFPIIAES